jgi:hypothetical protein
MANFSKKSVQNTNRYCYDANSLSKGKFVGIYNIETKQLVDKRDGFNEAVIWSGKKNSRISHENGVKAHKLGDNYWFGWV